MKCDNAERKRIQELQKTSSKAREAKETTLNLVTRKLQRASNRKKSLRD